VKKIIDQIVTDFKNIPKRYSFLKFLNKESNSDKTSIKKNLTQVTNINKTSEATSTGIKIPTPPKRKISPVMLIVILLVVSYVAFQEEIDKLANPAPAVTDVPPVPKKTEPKVEPPKIEEPIVETPTTEEPSIAITEPEPEPSEPIVSEPAPINLTEPSDVVTEPVVTDTPLEVLIPKEPEAVEPIAAVEPEPVIEKETAPEKTEDIVDITVPADSNPLNNLKNEDMSDQILADLEKQLKEKEGVSNNVSNYLNPPDYDYLGRGLVYNCKGRHWACIDGPSYKTCESNFSYLKNKNKAKECFPVSVFQTDRACQYVQKKKVSSNSETSFCQ
jgi:hypothetical protein